MLEVDLTMANKNHTQKLFKGKDAVFISAIWIGVYLLVTLILTGTITSSNVLNMLVGLTVALILSILFRNGW